MDKKLEEVINKLKKQKSQSSEETEEETEEEQEEEEAEEEVENTDVPDIEPPKKKVKEAPVEPQPDKVKAIQEQIAGLQNNGVFRVEVLFQLNDLNKNLDALNQILGGLLIANEGKKK